MNYTKIQSRPIAVAAIVSLSISGIFGLGAPAYASTAANPTIIFDGNSLATSVPASESSTRDSADSLSLSTGSLAKTSSTTRIGYTFGGWSLTPGGAATSTITTSATGDTTRTIYAVWNTKISYNLNGADSGSLDGSKTQDTYRFGQTLTLPSGAPLAKAGFAFGGWMPSAVSPTRSTTYNAASTDVGNPILYAAWIKTVTFNANTATTGTIPVPQVFVSGGTALKLPILSEMTLRKTGYDFMGWATTATGNPIANPGSYIPLTSQQTLFAVWKVQSSKATARVFFKPGKSTLRAGQKLVIRDMVDSLRGKTAITITVAATRARTNSKSLGKKRNTAVVRYLKSLGVTATYVRSNKVGKATLSTSKKNNRVTLGANWTNPVN
jgi:outer membrane protein OmpA-like peptidoglycan-associated protein